MTTRRALRGVLLAIAAISGVLSVLAWTVAIAGGI